MIDGVQCPNCGSGDFTYMSLDAHDSVTLVDKLACNDCGAYFVAEYKLSRVYLDGEVYVNGRKVKYPLLYDKIWLRKKYIDERLSTTEIAHVIGCGKTSVCSALERYQIPRRERTEVSGRIRNSRELKLRPSKKTKELLGL